MTLCNENPADEASIEYCSPSFEANKFSVQISDAQYSFQVLKSDGALLIWIGIEGEDKFADLSLGMTTAYDQVPVVTSVFGDTASSVSSNFAKRISRVLEKPVFISCNVLTDRLVLPLIEKNLIELIKRNPHVF